MLGCKFASCATQGGERSSCQRAGGSVPQWGEARGGSVAGMLRAGHLSHKAAFAFAENCPLNVCGGREGRNQMTNRQ